MRVIDTNSKAPKQFIVWADGVEITNKYETYEYAIELAREYRRKGSSNVIVTNKNGGIQWKSVS